MIIKCPNCERRFDLQRRPPVVFRCPKCSYSVPFNTILNEQFPDVDTEKKPDNSTTVENATHLINKPQHNETQIVAGLALGEKTEFVPSMQPQSRGMLQVTYHGTNYGVINLPQGNFYNLGRRSSDGQAQIKITPDISMSRIHAGMRTVVINGRVVYQITSAKADNPVFVNGTAVTKGQSFNLKSGDQIRMGETIMVFRMV